MKKHYRYLILIAIIMLTQSCAIRGVMIDEDKLQTTIISEEKKKASFFIVGNTHKQDPEFLDKVSATITSDESKNKTLLFVGNTLNGKDSISITQDLLATTALIKKTGATSYVVPGHDEWKYNKQKGLEYIEDYLEKELDQDDILAPNNGCPLESIELGEDIQLIIIDSQWYLENWDRHPSMNDKCQIKTRKKLMQELKGEIKKSENKLVFVVMQHPVFTNGFHAGRFSFRDHIFPLQGNIPLPGVATLLTEIRSQGGTSIQDRFNKRYNEFATELRAILDEPEHRIVMISGLEQNLQYIEQGSFKQIISGAGSETKPVTISDNGLFSYGGNGFANVTVYEDESVWVHFYDTLKGTNAQPLFQHKIFDPPAKPDLRGISNQFPKYVEAAVYNDSLVDKSDFFKSFWGQHYRAVYGTKVKARVAVLDTLYGGLEVERPGGGNQTRSLRLTTKSGKEYNMRALQKSAVQFLENTAFKGVNGEKYFTNTVPEELILDFYTAAHPYGAFAIPELAKAAEVFYTTPELYYVPKQERLGKYNEDYGDKLYMIVERPTDDFKHRKHFGYPDDVESTDDLLETLRDDEDYILDEEAYIRARIFDMLIGDWDRHSDQWRWAVFENDKAKKVFVPIPRDRDQVFANFDGTFLSALKSIMGSANQFGLYGDDIQDVKWFNAAGSKLDRALVKRSDKDVWMAEAAFLQQAIQPDVVNRAFKNLPEAVQDTTMQQIKRQLLARKENLSDIVSRYYDEFIKFQVLTGTDKDDHFSIERMPGGKTRILATRIQDGEQGDVLFDRIFDSAKTEEIWLYGLDDDDVFEVTGTGDAPVLIRIIGGQNKDSYTVDDGKKIKIYDRRSKNNEVVEKGGAHLRFTNLYEPNLYDYTRKPHGTTTFALGIQNNPDVGTSIGLRMRKTKTDFVGNPFGKRTIFNFMYHSITQGIAVDFEKTYAAIFGDINFLISGKYTSKNYTQNFFGFGNDTQNPDEQLSLDFNRVNMSFINGGVGLERTSDYGSFFQIKYDIESVEFFRNGDNFFNQTQQLIGGTRNIFGIPNATYTYANYDDKEIPTKGMRFTTTLGGIDSFQNNNLTGFADGSVTFYNSLLSNNRLVLKTNARTRILTGDMPLFYQQAQLGADNGLRAYRNQRFTGKQSLLGNADLSYRFQQMKTFLFPLTIIAYGGYDIGRVWTPNMDSDTWHSSYGGGLSVRWTNAMTADVSTFYGEDGVRLQFGFQLSY